MKLRERKDDEEVFYSILRTDTEYSVSGARF